MLHYIKQHLFTADRNFLRGYILNTAAKLVSLLNRGIYFYSVYAVMISGSVTQAGSWRGDCWRQCSCAVSPWCHIEVTASVAEPRVLVCAIAPCCWCVCSWSTPIGRIQVLLWSVKSLPKTDCSYCNLCSLTTDGNSLGLYRLWWK